MKLILRRLLFPVIFVIILWLIKFSEELLHLNFVKYGIYPLKLEGLRGIILSPLIHENYSHLIANTAPLLVLSLCLFYFYNEISYKVFFLIYVITNLWVWSFAREAYHIGASGLVYGLASFLFVSGFIRRHTQLMAISLLVIFLYGGIVWGVFPRFYPDPEYIMGIASGGIISGVVLALFYRKEGPQRRVYEWENEEENLNDEESVNEFLDEKYLK